MNNQEGIDSQPEMVLTGKKEVVHDPVCLGSLYKHASCCSSAQLGSLSSQPTSQPISRQTKQCSKVSCPAQCFRKDGVFHAIASPTEPTSMTEYQGQLLTAKRQQKTSGNQCHQKQQSQQIPHHTTPVLPELSSTHAIYNRRNDVVCKKGEDHVRTTKACTNQQYLDRFFCKGISIQY